jgi:chromosome segregation ATPase
MAMGSSGCRDSQAAPEVAGETPVAESAERSTKQYEDYRAGLFQIDAALTVLQDALRDAEKLRPEAKGDLREALLDLNDFLDSAGATLADISAPMPSREEYEKNFKSFDEDRLKAIEKLTDSLQDSRNALGTLTQLEEASTNLRAAFEALSGAVEEAVDAQEEAIRAFGGQLPPELTGP